MPTADEIPVSEHLRMIPPTVRPMVQAARRTVRAVAPEAKEISYRSQPPRSSRFMWKIVRYAVDGVADDLPHVSARAWGLAPIADLLGLRRDGPHGAARRLHHWAHGRRDHPEVFRNRDLVGGRHRQRLYCLDQRKRSLVILTRPPAPRAAWLR